MKRVFSLFLILCLFAVCSACSKDEKTDAGTPDSAQATEAAPATEDAGMAGRLEGNGYDSPEDAVMAYIEALNRGDVGGMLSTFAIESLIAHSNPILSMERNRSYNLNNFIQTPFADDYACSLAAQMRYGQLARDIQYTYAYCAEKDLSAVRIQTPEDFDALEEKFRQSPVYNMAGSVSFVRWLKPVEIANGITVLRSAGDTAASLAYAGGEDLAELTAHIRIGETDACIGIQCIRYDGRWYNLSFGTKALQFAGVIDLMDMILYIPPDGMEAFLGGAEEATPEETAAWDALTNSEIAGTRWPLESLSLPDVTVYDSPEAVQSAAGNGIWADMHFTRLGGGIITIAATPAVQQLLGMDDATARITFPWYPGTIMTSYQSNKGKEVPLFRVFHKEDMGIGFNGITAEMDDSKATLVLADGTTAVFRRPDPSSASAGSPATGNDAGRPAGSLEGSGYPSAEDAVMAYIDAMNRGDAREMLSTFAIETYAAHLDSEQWLQLFGTALLRMEPASIPVVDEYGRTLLAYARYGMLAQHLRMNYLWNAVGIDENIRFESTAEAREFAARFAQSPMNGLAGHVSFVRWIDPFILTGGDFLRNGSNILDTAEMNGADDVLDLTAEIRINGRPAYVGMQCAFYGDRWYNLNPGNVLLAFLRIEPPRQALWRPTDEEKAEIDRVLEQPDPEAAALSESFRQSSVAGTRWPLVSLSNPDITVCASAEDANNADGMAVWAEMRFGRMGGGRVSVAASPALRPIISVDEAGFFRPIPFSWKPADGDGRSGGISFMDFLQPNWLHIGMSSVASTAVQDDTTVTFTLPDGTEATFRKPE